MPAPRRKVRSQPDAAARFVRELLDFKEFNRSSIATELRAAGGAIVPVVVNEFWTAKQRAAHSLHEVSYRACFKPALPHFFVQRLTAPGDLVYDPFMGRGTTLVEAMLLGRRTAGCDVSPVARVFAEPRLDPPSVGEAQRRIDALTLEWTGEVWEELLVFYHPQTLRELTALRQYFLERERTGALDSVDRWLRMVAVNRLTGHSPGFFSVYTLPPNQAVSLDSQRRINKQREQTPPYRDVRALLARKSRQLLGDPVPELARGLPPPILMEVSSDATPMLEDGCVDLVVTSPPFLDVVDYATDNWLRAWFCGHDTKATPLWQFRKLDDWAAGMLRVFRELHRVLRPGGWLAFEVGEVKGGKVRLEETAFAIGAEAGLEPVVVMINDQNFTKTANCWGVTNATKGTNTNRVVVFRRAGA
ncbi:DNA methylase [Opitutales bacterium ASA1]|uniref:DNA methyltransferase n=1 Tax=Congregicoccus parvus TaxID=3081749 RepID=UPI002B291350|nr:DNA methylase [Opitutales bacterium ASA1]